MKMKLKSVSRYLLALIAVCTMLASCCMTASAKTPYHDYIYQSNSTETNIAGQPTSAAYGVETVIDWESLKLETPLKGVADIYERDGLLYILDAKNNRVVVIGLEDSKYQVKRIVTIRNEKGEMIQLGDAQGVYVDETGRVLVAVHDTGDISDKKEDATTGMVYICDKDGVVQKTIFPPKSDVIPDGILFRPINVTVNEHGQYFVLVDGSTRGTYQFDEELNFLGFFGSQKVQMTPALAWEFMWRKLFLSQKMIEGSERIVPTVFQNFDQSDDGYFYTIANPGEALDVGIDHVMKLNSLSKNVLRYPGLVYGDPMVSFGTGADKTIFTDIAVDKDGFMYCLDTARGRVFVYNQDSVPLTIFGCKTTSDLEKQWGSFASPSAVEVYQDRVFVADDANNTVTVFRESPYMNSLRIANRLTEDGRYEEAGPYWKDVLKYDGLSWLGNEGMARYYYAIEDYEKGMEYAERGYAPVVYSQIYKSYRDEKLNKYFPLIMAVVAVLIIVPIIFNQRALKKRSSQDEYVKHYTKFTFPFYCIMHPFKGFAELKYEKKTSLVFANVVVAMLFVSQVLYLTCSGFIWNPAVADIANFNIMSVFLTTVGTFFLFIVCNWAVTTLFNGEGKFTEIWCFTAYALMPMVLMRLPMILLSNFFTADEMAFLHIVSVIMYIWLAVTMLMATMEVHQYSFLGTVGALFFTLVAMILVISIVAIIYSLMLQMVSFFSNLSNEIILRL